MGDHKQKSMILTITLISEIFNFIMWLWEHILNKAMCAGQHIIDENFEMQASEIKGFIKLLKNGMRAA